MTILAQANDLSMIHALWIDRFPTGREHIMTSVANIAGINMSGVLAAGGHAMAGRTISGKIAMVRHTCSTQPTIGGMTDTAFISGRRMIRRLALRKATVVTSRTHAKRLRMIGGARWQRRPSGGVLGVTSIAHIGRRHVIGTFTARGNTVTGSAVSGKVCMVRRTTDTAQFPSSRGMANVTFFRGIDVSGGRWMGMARRAQANHLSMIDPARRYRTKRRGATAVTFFAIIRR